MTIKAGNTLQTEKISLVNTEMTVKALKVEDIRSKCRMMMKNNKGKKGTLVTEV